MSYKDMYMKWKCYCHSAHAQTSQRQSTSYELKDGECNMQQMRLCWHGSVTPLLLCFNKCMCDFHTGENTQREPHNPQCPEIAMETWHKRLYFSWLSHQENLWIDASQRLWREDRTSWGAIRKIENYQVTTFAFHLTNELKVWVDLNHCSTAAPALCVSMTQGKWS